MDIKIKKGKQGNLNGTIGTTMVTPIATVLSSWLDKPYVAEDGKASYSITLGFRKGSDDAKYIDDLIAKIQPGWDAFCKEAKIPAGAEMNLIKDDDKNPEYLVLRFATSAKAGPDGKFPSFADVYDRLRKHCPAPWKGSKVRISFTPSGWKTAMGRGVKLYLNGVLVVDGVFGRNAQADFDAFYDAEESTPEASGDDVPDATSFV